MSLQSVSPPKHLMFTNARPEAFAHLTRAILGRLGYGILTESELALLERESEGHRPPIEMLIVDEHRACDEIELPELAGGASLPIILLTGRRGIRSTDLRIIAGVKRPAGLHDLYQILQQQFEAQPRSTPRVDAELGVTCSRQGKRWSGEILSISDNGCLMRSGEDLPLGTTISIEFSLPQVGALEIDAEIAYQLVPDVGLVFNAIEPEVREAIGSYVVDTLAAG